jgi:hypothetical protein
MENKDNIYQAGFNSGYWIKKHLPKLFASLSKGIQTKNDFVDGFIEGGKEMRKEIELEQLRGIRSNKDRDVDYEI